MEGHALALGCPTQALHCPTQALHCQAQALDCQALALDSQAPAPAYKAPRSPDVLDDRGAAELLRAMASGALRTGVVFIVERIGTAGI